MNTDAYRGIRPIRVRQFGRDLEPMSRMAIPASEILRLKGRKS